MALTYSPGIASLAELRRAGQRPALPVMLTSQRTQPYRLRGCGAIVIWLPEDEEIPAELVQLLKGLDLIVIGKTCHRALDIVHAAQAADVKLGRVETWCACSSMLCVMAMPRACCIVKDAKHVD